MSPKIELVFWKGGEVITTNWGESRALIRGVTCIDLSETNAFFRYGEFLVPEGWKHIPKEEFPKEFLVHLLLMGID